jgi:hypothetical protein
MSKQYVTTLERGTRKAPSLPFLKLIARPSACR